MRTLALLIFGILVPLPFAPVQDGQEPEYVYPKEFPAMRRRGCSRQRSRS